MPIAEIVYRKARAGAVGIVNGFALSAVMLWAGAVGSDAAAAAKDKSIPAPSTASASPDASSKAPTTDEVWQGLERHEIQLGQKLLLVKGKRGIVACPYLNINTFKREVCAIVPARDFEGMLKSKVTAVSPLAEALGIKVGMSGREALERIR